MSHSHKIVIIGSGVAGLCAGLCALDLGYAAALVSEDAVSETTSAMAAGMIAPALEALNEPDPVLAFKRRKSVESEWISFAEGLGLGAMRQEAKPAILALKDPTALDVAETRLREMGAMVKRLDEPEFDALNLPLAKGAIAVQDDWLIAADAVAQHLARLFVQRGGRMIFDQVTSLHADAVELQSSGTLKVGHMIMAAGYGAKVFADQIPSLAVLSPIKGHLLDIIAPVPEAFKGQVVRFGGRYVACLADGYRFGATMQTGEASRDLDLAAIDGLRREAAELLPKALNYDPSFDEPKLGIRAATPDGWPLIGQDRQSGVWIIGGLKRNGWLYGPYAGKAIIDALCDRGSAIDPAYDPNRFLGH